MSGQRKQATWDLTSAVAGALILTNRASMAALRDQSVYCRLALLLPEIAPRRGVHETCRVVCEILDENLGGHEEVAGCRDGSQRLLRPLQRG